jgi:hypothetical protein
MADTLITDKNLSFGITDTAALGFFESYEVEVVKDKIEAKDGDGDIIGVDFHSKRTTVTGTFVMDTTATLPEPGSSITVTQTPQSLNSGSNGSLYVDTIKEIRTNADVLKVDFTATSYPDIT